MAQQQNQSPGLGAASWQLPEEYRMLRDTVRRFMREEVKPIEDKLPHDAISPTPEDLARLQARARSLDLWCVHTQAEYGGAGLDLLAQCVVDEESAKCRMGLQIPACGAFGMDPPYVIFGGTPEQIDKYGRPAVELGQKTFVALSEPSGGSDPARAISTRAELKGDRYVVNGTKMWIGSVEGAKWGVLYARTGAKGDRGGITAFIIDPKRPGMHTRQIGVMRALQPFEIHFDNYEIPVEDRLGEEGGGFQIAADWAVRARVRYSSLSVGVAQEALGMAIEWARQRETFGHRLSERQAVQWMIADSEMELRAARLLIYQAACKGDRGENIKVDASIAKVYGTEASFRVIDRCVQIFGGMGVAHEMPLERWFREMRIRRIAEGASEVQRMVLARDLLSDHRDREN